MIYKPGWGGILPIEQPFKRVPEPPRNHCGHLRDTPLELSRGLNSIIGARGTCKSTIVETIRFLFDDDEARVAEPSAATKPPVSNPAGRRLHDLARV